VYVCARDREGEVVFSSFVSFLHFGQQEKQQKRRMLAVWGKEQSEWTGEK